MSIETLTVKCYNSIFCALPTFLLAFWPRLPMVKVSFFSTFLAKVSNDGSFGHLGHFGYEYQ